MRRALLAAAGRQREPMGSTLVFADGFESGDFTMWQSCQWTGRNDDCQSYNGTADYSAAVVDAGPGHPHAARFELRDGDSPFLGTERTEIGEPSGATTVGAGDERWISWDMMFDDTWPVPHASSGWTVPWQWHHNSDEGSPAFLLDIDTDDVIYVANNDASGYQRTAISPVVRGVWQHWVLHVVFSDDIEVGYCEGWIDGELVFPKEFRRTMVVGDTGNYFKCGVYRDPVNTATAIIYHDNIRITAP